jgi:hypothetical protein
MNEMLILFSPQRNGEAEFAQRYISAQTPLLLSPRLTLRRNIALAFFIKQEN